MSNEEIPLVSVTVCCTCVHTFACVFLYLSMNMYIHMYVCIPYSGNVKKLADSIKSDETAISKLKDEEKNKLEV